MLRILILLIAILFIQEEVMAESQALQKLRGQAAEDISRESNFNSQFARLLGTYEGLRTKAYKDTEGIPTIGIGATYYPPGFRLKGRVKMGDKITEEEARQIKAAHIEEHRKRLLREVPEETYAKVPDNVKAALESKVFNYGSLGKPLARLVTAATETGDYKPVSDYFRNVLSKHNRGVNAWRRNDEADLIDTGKSNREKGVYFAPPTPMPAAVPQPTTEATPAPVAATPAPEVDSAKWDKYKVEMKQVEVEGKKGQIPLDKLDQFLQDNPGATVLD